MDRIVILGGTGMVGQALARLLLDHTDAAIVIAGRRAGTARSVAETLGGVGASTRISSAGADVTNPATLGAAVAGARLVVNAAPSADGLAAVVRAALGAGADCLDTLLSQPEKHAVLYALEPEIQAAGRTVITDGGFHPGLPAVLVRDAASRLSELHTADVQARLKMDLSRYRTRPETRQEFIREIAQISARAYVDGRWQTVSTLNPPPADFGGAWGRAWIVPMAIKEMEALPGLIPTLRRTGFWMAGFHPVIDLLVMPLIGLAMRIAPDTLVGPMAALFAGSVRWLTGPPFGGVVQMTATGSQHGQPASLTYRLEGQDLAVMTAAPVAATIRQLLDGSARQPGVHCQGLLVDPGRLLDDMAAMGVPVAVAAA